MTAPAIQLDFRRPPRSRWRRLGWALLALAAMAAAALADRHARVDEQHAAAQARHLGLSESLRARTPRRNASAPDAQTLADVKRANAIIDQLAVPWDSLFDAVEAADARGLGLLALTPNARERTLRLSGEARDLAQLLAYVERLSQQPALGQVHVVGYSQVEREGASVLSFTLAAMWKQQP